MHGKSLFRIESMSPMEDDEPEIRPLPLPPRCRGIPVGQGGYTGCAYGYGDLAPYTGPCDCPVCNGSGFEPGSAIATTLPHCDLGALECCGCLAGIIRGDQADIVCNECEAVIRTVSAAELQKTLDELELSLNFATAKCAHCGAIHVRSGLTELRAFKCRQCGQLNKVSDDPMIERFFGSSD